MEYRLLGRTGVSVSPLCLGTMMFGPWGNDDRADAIRVIHRALDAGINFVDTADVYSGGVSEEITGEAMGRVRDATADPILSSFPDRRHPDNGTMRLVFPDIGAPLSALGTRLHRLRRSPTTRRRQPKCKPS
jgi:hypothetical protein